MKHPSPPSPFVAPSTRRAPFWRGAAFLLALVALPAALAQVTTLRTFTGDSVTANLVQASDGTIYGVTRPSSGSSSANGYVFKLQPDGSGYQAVYTFPAGGSGVARLPDYSFILGRDGVLYGTSEFGGSANYGMLYKVNPDGSGFGLLKSFTAGGAVVVKDGGAPKGGLVHASDGFLYGVTTTGTVASNNLADRNGVIYRIAPDGSGYRLLFSFDGGDFSPNGTGANSLIEGRDGKLYGTTQFAGANGSTGSGTVFTIQPDGNGFTVLQSFGNTTSSTTPRPITPRSPLVHAADGFLYGTTLSGGKTGNGCIYRLRTDGSGLEVIYSFSSSPSTQGYDPAGAFFEGRDGSLYGRTNSGGTSNFGVIYKIRTDGTGYRVLASFSSSRSAYFNGLIQGADGALYATTDSTIIRVVEAPGLEISQQPRGQTVAAGGTATFTVTAATATSYQWRRNGTNITGATSASLTLNNLSTANNGTYTVVVTNATDSVTSAGAVLLVAVPDPGRLINLSVRTDAGSGAQTLIAGLSVGGTGSKQVLVRGIGPTLTAFNVGGALSDPKLALFNSGSVQLAANNTGWGGTAELTAAFSQVGAFALPAASRDAALLSSLSAGGYSAQVTSVGGGTGVALVEAYDADGASSGSRFTNLSARSVAGTGAQTLIAGFVLSGNVPKTLLIRGVGPGLTQFNVAGVLASPRLELHTTINNQDTVVASNAGWAGAASLTAAFGAVGAFGLPAGSADAALLVNLTPGSYTAQVTGANGGTGVALIEIYEVP